MRRNRNLIIGILLAATAGLITYQSGIAPSSDSTSSPPSITKTIIYNFTDTPSPTTTPAYQGCAYVWANHNSPELTERINTAVQELSTEASASAEFFGEDCVYADGSSSFGAMETDFYIQLPVDNLTDEDSFGNWVTQVLSSVLQIPKEEIQGNYGFVDFSFIKSETETIILHVPIQIYISEATGKSGSELFQFFSSPPVNPT